MKNVTSSNLQNLMISTDPRGKGGIASVVASILSDPFALRWEIQLVTSHRQGSKVLMVWLFLRSLAQIFLYRLKGKPGLAHIHLASRGSFSRKYIIAKWSRLLGFRVLIHLHGGEFDTFYETECSQRNKRRIASMFYSSDAVVVLGNKWLGWVQRNFPTVNKLKIIYNCGPIVCLQRFNPAVPTLVFLGRLSFGKGVQDIISALPDVLSIFPNLKVVIGGDGDNRVFQNQATLLGIAEHIEFAGWIGKERKFQLLATGSAYVLPSYNEGFPVGIIEAMAAGIPIVASNVGGIPDAITDQQEGLLIPAGDVTALANAIIRVLSEQELASRLANNALVKFQREFSCGSIMPQWQQIYEDLLSDRRN